MVEVTATLVKNILNETSITTTNMEYLIDLAISEISLHSGEDMPTMGGTAGSKTVSLTNQQYGAIMEAVRAIYYSFYKGVETSTVGGLAVSTPDLQSNPQVQATIQKAARRLAEFDVDYG